jgi:hypothetical protein
LKEAFISLGRGFERPWKKLLKTLEEAFKDLGTGF